MSKIYLLTPEIGRGKGVIALSFPPILRVLFIHTDMALRQLVQAALPAAEFSLRFCPGVDQAMNFLAGGGADIVLSGIPFSGLLPVFADWRDRMPQIPVVVLLGEGGEQDAVAMIRAGVQDILTSGQVKAGVLPKALHYAVERQSMLARLREEYMMDELTGLYNRRGFLTLAGQCLKMAERSGQPAVVLFADVDDLKRINDTFGHGGGDQALKNIAILMRETFRFSDIVARIGGDEFVIFLPDADLQDAECIMERLDRAGENSGTDGASLSVGAVVLHPGDGVSLEELIAKADEAMYQKKRAKKQTVTVRPSCNSPLLF